MDLPRRVLASRTWRRIVFLEYAYLKIRVAEVDFALETHPSEGFDNCELFIPWHLVVITDKIEFERVAILISLLNVNATSLIAREESSQLERRTNEEMLSFPQL
jgi:hypothetical protein